jgi:Xaa-Pro aminopeptidase
VREALLDAMAADDLDVLVLGRPANVLAASGANQLWTSGTRPFGPGAVVVASTGKVHLLSTWDEGVPSDIGHDELFGLSWNPANIAASLAAIPGLAAARRIGTDSMSPGFPRLLAAIAPQAELVDARPVLVRRPDVEAIATATRLAEAALAAMVEALRPGVTERELVGAYVARIAELGAPTPPTEGVACVTSRSNPVLRRVATDAAAAEGDLVVLDVGARVDGWEGGLGRTFVVGGGPSPLADRCPIDAVVAACRPGATGADLKAAGVHLAHGVGLGMEPPVITEGVGDAAVLTEGMVLAVTCWVAEAGVGGHLERDLVQVGDTPRVLSRGG